MPIRLIYYSRALNKMSLQDIQNILTTARENNSSQGICGMLCYESNWFLQTLEGERDAVNELFLEIADDVRHDDVVIISYEYIDECIFPDWHMGYSANSGAVSDLLKSFGHADFEPEQLSPSQALEFLQTMSFQQNDEAA
ncbi:MAG: BLUF domain-containing protein, partial [Granulosicoccaceae bacterium]